MRLFSRVFATIVILVASAPFASAHSSLSGSNPSDMQTIYADLKVISLDFSEGIALLPDAFTLVNSKGERVLTEEAKLDTLGNISTVSLPLGKKLEDGWYAVGWKVVSSDGHPRTGAFSFSVDANSDGITGESVSLQLLNDVSDPDKSLRPLIQVVRTLGYLTMLLLTGLSVFLLFIFYKPLKKIELIYFRKYLVSISGAGAIITLLNWSLENKVLFASFFTIQNLLILPTGKSYVLRLIIYLLLFSLLLSKKYMSKIILYAPLSIFITLSYVLTGHTAVLAPRWLGGTSLFIHLLTAAIWCGGLFGLFLCLRYLSKNRDGDIEFVLEDKKWIISKFSILASSALAILAIAATSLAITTLGDISKLFSTNYGKALSLKIIFVLLLAIIGAYNHYILIPRITLIDNSFYHNAPVNDTAIAEDLKLRGWLIETSLAKLYRLLKLELLLIVVIAVVAGLLTTHTAPRVQSLYGEESVMSSSDWAFLLPGHAHTPGMDMSSYGRVAAKDETVVQEKTQIVERIVGSGSIESYKVTIALGGSINSPLLYASLLNPAGESGDFQSLEISFMHKKSKVGPLVRNATFRNNRWEIAADDLQINGVLDVTIKARVDNFTFMKGDVLLTIT